MFAYFGRVQLFEIIYTSQPKTLIVCAGYSTPFYSAFKCEGSYLKCPHWWIIPQTNNPFATVERMRAPVGSPPGPAGVSSSASLLELLQAGPPILHLIIHAVPALRPRLSPAATGRSSVWSSEAL